MWKDETTNLANIILQVIKYTKINKKNNKNNAKVKIMAASIYQAPKKTCMTKECIEKEVTTHYTNQYCIIYPELYAKYFFH